MLSNLINFPIIAYIYKLMNIIVEKKEALTTILINRPKVKNAIDGITAQQLAEAFRDFEADESALVAVLGGKGDTFCAGADLKALSGDGEPNKATPEGDGPLGPTRMLLSKPVIAAVSGYAVAGGLELALWCDLRVIERTATMGVFCRRWGVPLMDGGTVRLPRLIGMSRAMDLILTGRPVNAEEAYQIGLANRLVENGKALESAQALALEITKFPQQCLRNDRISAYQQWEFSIKGAMQKEFEWGMKTIEIQETLQGAQRFASGKGRHGSFCLLYTSPSPRDS